MEPEVVGKPELEPSIYAGAIATFVVSLLPYINDFILPAYIAGGFVATWHALRKRHQILTYKNSAKLGFLSTFFGALAAAVVFDIIWQFFDFQLWQKQNGDLMIAIFRTFASPATVDAMSAGMAQNAGKPFAWYFIILQLAGGAIFAGTFGSLFGMLGEKIFREVKTDGAVGSV